MNDDTLIRQTSEQEEIEITPSKTEVKRHLKAIKALGVSISELPSGQFQKIPLQQPLLTAIQELRSISSNVAKKRQTQYVAKLLAKADNLSEIQAAYEHVLGVKQELAAQFHAAERWREQLLADPKQTLTTFLNEYPTVPSQQLRHLLKKAADERQKGTSQGAYKALFRLIKAAIDE